MVPSIECNQSSSSSISFAGWTLCIPSINVGNVGQLAVDSLIHNVKKFHLVERIHSRNVLPMAGPNAFSLPTSNITTSVEVYANEEDHIAVIQQRSPSPHGRRSLWASEVWSWARQKGFSRIVVLASSLAGHRNDIEMSCGDLVQYSVGHGAATATKELADIGIASLKVESLSVSSNPMQDMKLPGGILSRHFIDSSNKTDANEGLGVVMLVKYCSEGDNAQDGVIVAAAIAQWLGMNRENTIQWTAPPSWAWLWGSVPERHLFL